MHFILTALAVHDSMSLSQHVFHLTMLDAGQTMAMKCPSQHHGLPPHPPLSRARMASIMTSSIAPCEKYPRVMTYGTTRDSLLMAPVTKSHPILAAHPPSPCSLKIQHAISLVHPFPFASPFTSEWKAHLSDSRAIGAPATDPPQKHYIAPFECLIRLNPFSSMKLLGKLLMSE